MKLFETINRGGAHTRLQMKNNPWAFLHKYTEMRAKMNIYAICEFYVC